MNLNAGLKRLRRKLGWSARYFAPIREVVEPPLRMWRFERDRRARAKRYHGADWAFEPRSDIVQQIDRDGFAIVRNAIDPAKLLDIRQQTEALLDSGSALLPVSRDSARNSEDFGATSMYLSAGELRLGQDYFRRHANYVSVANPLVTCPATVAAAFHPLLADIAWSYLGCVPAIGGMNLRKSYSNALPTLDTLFFHVDPNSPRFLKFFFYLQDVDMNGGPFSFVRGSHKKRFPGWKRKIRWTQEEMETAYGRDQICYLTANRGDLLIADTNGFHRGTKVISTDRLMLTVDYVVHEELGGTQDRSLFQLPRTVYESLPRKQQAVADYLQVVL